MKKNLLLIITLAGCFSLQAKQVDVSTAKSIAQKVLHINSSISTRAAEGNSGLNLVYTATADNAIATRTAAPTTNNLFYVFSQSDNKGFVIVSADDAVSPILAYSHENSFDGDNIPCNVQAVLDNYRAAITEAIAIGKDASAEWSNVATRTEEETVEGEYLIKTKWAQGWPENAQVPMLDEERCAAGCVAIAMAQVMNYWKYPEKGTGSNEYTWYSQKLTTDFSKSFDWDNMPKRTNYGQGKVTAKEADAVSYLVDQCGLSINMSYGRTESGASVYYMLKALYSFFGYNANTMGHFKMDEANSDTSKEKMLNIIKNELDNGRPMIEEGNFHCYICDGLVDDYMHLNFGWGGGSDGFYKLMGGTNAYANNTDQILYYGITPHKEVKAEITAQNFEFVAANQEKVIDSGSTVMMDFNLYGLSDVDVECAVVSVNEANDIVDFLGICEYPATRIPTSGYKLYKKACYCLDNICNDSDADKEITMLPAYKQNGKWTVLTNVEPLKLTVHPFVAPTTNNPNATVTSLPFHNSQENAYLMPSDNYITIDAIFGDNFKGTMSMSIKDMNGTEIAHTDKSIVARKQKQFYTNFSIPELEEGKYLFSFSLSDTEGNTLPLGGETEKTITCSSIPQETYLAEFKYDESIYDAHLNNLSVHSNAVFSPGTKVQLKGKLINPNDKEDTRIVGLLHTTPDGSERYEYQTINIPANGEQSFSTVVNADEKGFYSVVVEEAHASSDGYYYYTNFAKINDDFEQVGRYFYIKDAIHTLNLAKAPSVSTDSANLEIKVRQQQHLYFYYTNEEFKNFSYDEKLQFMDNYKVVLQLYNGEQQVAEKEGYFDSFYSDALALPLDSLDVALGDYIMKVFTEHCGTRYAMLDENGNTAEYKVKVVGPELMLEIYPSDTEEDYMFSSANNNVTNLGNKCHLRYSLRNPNKEDFIGSIKVLYSKNENYQDPNAQSEETQITVKANSAETVYGTIDTEKQGNLRLACKSQYASDYKIINSAGTYSHYNNYLKLEGLQNASLPSFYNRDFPDVPIEEYVFENKSDTCLEVGEKATFKYCIWNPYDVDFDGKIKVDLCYKVKGNNENYKHVSSEEIPLKVKERREEIAYGSIEMTIPEELNRADESAKVEVTLKSKSQFEEDYRYIMNVMNVYCTIEKSSSINSAASKDGATIHDGKITLGEGKTIKSAVVYDVAGRSIVGYTVSGNEINLQSLSSGIYIINIYTGDPSPIRLKIQR